MLASTMTDDHGLDAKLEGLARQYDDVSAQLATPEVHADPAALKRLGRELARLEPVVAAHRELEDVRGAARRAPARCATRRPTTT